MYSVAGVDATQHTPSAALACTCVVRPSRSGLPTYLTCRCGYHQRLALRVLGVFLREKIKHDPGSASGLKLAVLKHWDSGISLAGLTLLSRRATASAVSALLLTGMRTDEDRLNQATVAVSVLGAEELTNGDALCLRGRSLSLCVCVDAGRFVSCVFRHDACTSVV